MYCIITTFKIKNQKVKSFYVLVPSSFSMLGSGYGTLYPLSSSNVYKSAEI